MTVTDWKEKMRIIKELMPRDGIALRYRAPPKPVLPEPDFSLDELEKAQKVIDGLG